METLNLSRKQLELIDAAIGWYISDRMCASSDYDEFYKEYEKIKKISCDCGETQNLHTFGNNTRCEKCLSK